jgi:hypothetical protein
VKPVISAIDNQAVAKSINDHSLKHGVRILAQRFYEGDDFTACLTHALVRGSHEQTLGVTKRNPKDIKDRAYGQRVAMQRAIRAVFDLAK